MSEVGQEIRRLRMEKDWSQAQLAVYAGSSQPTVNQIETGARNPSASTLQKIATALGVEVGDLFPKAPPPQPKFRAAAQSVEWQEGLARIYRVAAVEGHAALRTPKPDFERVRVFHDLLAGLARIRGPRDILGSEFDALADAIAEVEEVDDQVQVRIQEWFADAPEEEKRSALEQIGGTEYEVVLNVADG